MSQRLFSLRKEKILPNEIREFITEPKFQTKGIKTISPKDSKNIRNELR